MTGLFCAGTTGLVSFTTFWEWYYTFLELNGNPSFWAIIFLVVLTTVAKDIYICILERVYNYKNYHIIQEHEVKRGVAEAEVSAHNSRNTTTIDGDDYGVIGAGAL